MMEEAVDAALKSGATTDPILGRIFFSRRINHYLGGGFVAPWTVDLLGEEWLNAFVAIFSAGIRSAEKQRLETLHEDFRKRHPTFGKYR